LLDSYNFLVFSGKAKYFERSLYNVLGYRLGEFEVNLYFKLQSFEFLVIGTPAIPCSILKQLEKVLLIDRFSFFAIFVKSYIKYLPSLPTDHRRLVIRIVLCSEILGS